MLQWCLQFCSNPGHFSFKPTR